MGKMNDLQARIDSDKLVHRRYTSGTDKVQLRAADDSSGETAVGYAAVFYREGVPGTEYDLGYGYVERIAPGAFDSSLADGDDVVALFNHSSDNVLGRIFAKTLSLSVDEIGLRYEISMPATTLGSDLASLIRRGDISGSSFSFVPRETTYIETDDDTMIIVRTVVSLIDMGPVTFPAYEATTAEMRSMVLAEIASERSRKMACRRSQKNARDRKLALALRASMV